MHRARVLRSVLATLLAGALTGYVLATFAAPLAGNLTVLTGVREPIGARSLMIGFLAGDRDARAYVIGHSADEPDEVLLFVTPDGVASRALELQMADLLQTWTPASLTYLGGDASGGVGHHLYALGGLDPEGDAFVFPMEVTTVGDSVVDVR